MPKVLISDKLSDAAVEIFRQAGVEVDFRPELGKDPAALARVIGDYDGLAIRSATKVTADLLDHAKNLRVIGRAGIGVDNVDSPAASAKGIVVMNTPFGNSITTAEHAIAMMFALARQIPAADMSTRAGKWEKNRFLGVEITGKTLGLVGAGNIGSVVASRAIGLKMKVIAYDPFLSAERAQAMGVTKVDEIEDLLEKADFVTLHLPKTEKTANLLSAERIARMKPGARLINCARGGLVDEVALAAALESGHLAGAALDVFEVEPATDSPLFNAPNVVCTPHLGAATSEAQENVALQVAEQMSAYLMVGAISNALNAPSVTAEEAPVLKPWIELCELLGGFAGQVTDNAIKEIEVEFVGDVASMNLRPLMAATTASLLLPLLGEGGVNMVSAPIKAREMGIKISETRRDAQGAFGSYIRLIVTTEKQQRAVAGTIYSDGRPCFIQIKGINLEAEPMPNMLYTTNTDMPGFIGALGTQLGALNINIATFALGRANKAGEAIALIGIDETLDAAALAAIEALPQVRQAKYLRFARYSS
ncbi:phosphoglycerate dehydrogenase [Abyssibius alkaniclasticus]|uniref:phosphoglycerate dehydrogenase n=1 Tax=Abyssibius alkaniclasticus TaxID=2881234 RepID=UPI004058E80F